MAFFQNNFDFSLPEIDIVHESKDRTVKFLFNLKDNHKIETVLIPFHKKYSICLSSQVGCAMNCSFCFTGKQGLKRNLTTSEIVGQFLEAPDDAEKLGTILTGKSAYINLIPFNSFPGSHYKRPDLDKIEKFKEVLDTFKIPTLRRSAKGDDILAACGQLNSKNKIAIEYQ